MGVGCRALGFTGWWVWCWQDLAGKGCKVSGFRFSFLRLQSLCRV